MQANVLPLVAFGNNGEDRYGYFDEVLGVGAVNIDGVVADFSGSGQPETTPDRISSALGLVHTQCWKGSPFRSLRKGHSCPSPQPGLPAPTTPTDLR